MTKEFDVIQSIEINEKELLRKLDRGVYQSLIEWTKPQLTDYDTTLALLREERRFLTQFFKEKLEEYNVRFPAH